jgi:NAD(P)-dependent dehydrogenase (short-subunit alcohol dehydrogenase family)
MVSKGVTADDNSAESRHNEEVQMNGSAVLQGKHAAVFGAGGSIGAAVAKEFAAEGAEVFLSGRSLSQVDDVARQITTAGGCAHTAAVDVLDDAGVNEYVRGVAKQAGTLDIVVDATGPRAAGYGNAKMAAELTIDEFMLPVTTILKSHFITARAAARQMTEQRSGVIIFVTGSPSRGHVPGATAIGAAFGAIECLTENLAIEVGPFGVRVVCVRTLANVDSRSIQDTTEFLTSRMNITPEQANEQILNSNFLKRVATVSDTARAVVLAASDNARMMTGTVLNATAGAALD